MLQLASQGVPRGLRIVAVLWVMTLSFGASFGTLACSSDVPERSATDSTQTQTSEDGRIEPRYQPREPEPKPWYNSKLLFGMTRGVANSTIAPAAQVPLMVLTVPLDIVFLPFAAIGGFF